MGFIPEATPEMGEYSVEVRRESFYLSGAANFRWVRGKTDINRDIFVNTSDTFVFDERNDHLIEVSEEECQPVGEGWVCRYVTRRHGIFVYENGESGQGTIEILFEDISKIRAALDLVEQTAKG